MSRRYENQCVDCELPCLGNSCPFKNVPVDDCDGCDERGTAEYKIDGDDLCEECTKFRIKEAFDDLTLFEQAELLDMDLKRIND